jgi:hypothetical protein
MEDKLMDWAVPLASRIVAVTVALLGEPDSVAAMVAVVPGAY